jgi:imidazolonepropionase-like amidohydrolase
MIRNVTLSFLLMLTSGASAARSESLIAITGGRLLTVTHGAIEGGTVLVENGKIIAVGRDVRVPGGAQVIDARGKVVIPGLIDAGDRLGLVEIPAERTSVDSTEYTDPIHPELRVLDALNPGSELLRVTRAAGITNALSTPAEGNLIAGQSALINLDGETVEQLVVESPAALHINLGEASKRTYGEKGKPPDTRMGEMAMLRQAFLRAQHYKQEQEAFAKRQTEKSEKKNSSDAAGGDESKPMAPPARDLKMEALVQAMEGKLPVVVDAHRVSDIETALRLADEFKLKLILSSATSAWRMASELAAREIPVIVGPIQEIPDRMESLDARLDNAAILYRAGVPIAIKTDADNDVRELPFAVQYAIGNGLPRDAALAAVTLNPARFFGLDSRLGSLDQGKQANIVVLDGMPFQTKTHVTAEFINGKPVDLTNHQTELYEFYKKKYGLQ